MNTHVNMVIIKKIPIITIFLILMILLWSCNTQVAMNLKKNNHMNIGVTINVEKFFATYLQDLFGFEKFSDLVNAKALIAYFDAIDGVTSTDLHITNESRTVYLAIDTDNFLDTLSNLDVLVKQGKHNNTNNATFRMTKDVFTDILMQLPGFDTVDLSLLLASENGAVKKESYAEYIAWALSDYADTKYIKKSTADSSITLKLVKASNQGNMPDAGWKKIPKLYAQQKQIPFIEWLYANKHAVSFTY